MTVTLPLLHSSSPRVLAGAGAEAEAGDRDPDGHRDVMHPAHSQATVASECPASVGVRRGRIVAKDTSLDTGLLRGTHMARLQAFYHGHRLATRMNQAVDDAANQAWHRASSILKSHASSNADGLKYHGLGSRNRAKGSMVSRTRTRIDAGDRHSSSAVHHDMSPARLHMGLEAMCLLCEDAARAALQYRA